MDIDDKEKAVITVCTECKRIISVAPPHDPEEKVSHGICPKCLPILERKLKKDIKEVSNSLATKKASHNSNRVS